LIKDGINYPLKSSADKSKAMANEDKYSSIVAGALLGRYI
jgi:hypothetical protein